MNKFQWRITLLIMILMLSGPGPVPAQHNHGTPSHDMGGMATQDVLVDDIVVSFSVMANPEHLKMLQDMKMKEDIEPGTTHNITVVLMDQATRQPITYASVSMRVVDPSGKDQIKALKFESSMNSYNAYFNMPEKGRYQVLVLARYDGQKKTGGIYYNVQ